MKFYFNKLILWCKNGTTREVDFLPNKVNVITGGSGTGKSAILQIIDYCFFATSHKISEDVINENTEWYGINFFINNKTYTIARKSPKAKNVTNQYYFSSQGVIPKKPKITDTNDLKLKAIIESDFSINSNIIMPGAKEIRKDTKISFRYFMLFNTISYSIIDNEDTFFDKQHKERYRNALERIFDLSLGIETIENILVREEKKKLNDKLEKLEKKDNIAISKKNTFHNEISTLIKTAKEYGLIQSDDNTKNSIDSLKNIIATTSKSMTKRNTDKYQTITKEIYLLEKKIDNLNSFETEYNLYKKSLKETEDSLKPIMYLNKHSEEIIKTSIYNKIVTSLENDFIKIKNAIKNKTPINTKVIDLSKEYKNKIEDLRKELKEIPEDIKSFENSIDKYIFIGEVKAKLELFEDKTKSITSNVTNNIKEIKDKISHLKVNDIAEQRRLTISLLEEKIQEDMNFIKDALSNYCSHKATFNLKDKKLELRQPHSDHTVNTGSSSVDMFLHLLMFLGLHKIILTKKAPNIAPYLIMDQPSKPYYGENDDNYKDIKETDKFKIENVFKLLNNFITNRNKDEEDFQIILFEHVPKSTWKDMKNIHLVEEFRNGNALVRQDNKL